MDGNRVGCVACGVALRAPVESATTRIHAARRAVESIHCLSLAAVQLVRPSRQHLPVPGAGQPGWNVLQVVGCSSHSTQASDIRLARCRRHRVDASRSARLSVVNRYPSQHESVSQPLCQSRGCAAASLTRIQHGSRRYTSSD